MLISVIAMCLQSSQHQSMREMWMPKHPAYDEVRQVFELQVGFLRSPASLSVSTWSKSKFSNSSGTNAMRLTLSANGRITRVDSLQDLDGWVELKTEQDALTYLQLETSPLTFYSINQGNSVALMSMKEFDLESVFGCKYLLTAIRASGEASRGLFGYTEWASNQEGWLASAHVEKNARGYVVTRNLLVSASQLDPWHDLPECFREVTELASDGKVVFRDKKQLSHLVWPFAGNPARWQHHPFLVKLSIDGTASP